MVDLEEVLKMLRELENKFDEKAQRHFQNENQRTGKYFISKADGVADAINTIQSKYDKFNLL